MLLRLILCAHSYGMLQNATIDKMSLLIVNVLLPNNHGIYC